jgi:beta propeller repeat protein
VTAQEMVVPHTGHPGIHVTNADGTGTAVALTDGVDNRPGWSADGARIAFLRVGQAYFMDADGSGQSPLGPDLGPVGSVTWSPDWSKIAFRKTPNVAGGLYVLNADGTDEVCIATDTYWSSQPVWSPDGSRIAFCGDRSGTPDLYTVNADGSNAVLLGSQTSSDGSLSWSPDGSRIAYASSRSGVSRVYLANTDGSGEVQLVSSASGPVWSSDGSRIAFQRSQSGVSGIYVVNADGSGETRLSTRGKSPAWSPDSARIAFVSGYTVIVASADGSGETELATDLGVAANPAWSPDGSKVAYSSSQAFGNHELSTVSRGRIAYTDMGAAYVKVFDVATGSTALLTGDSIFSMNPGIDGDIVAWEDRRDGNYELYAQDLSTGEVRRVTNSPERDLRPDVDGTFIVWERAGATNVDIWIYDWTTGLARQITNTPFYERLPDVSGDLVVYEANRDGDQDIFAYDLTTSTERRLALPGYQTNPSISGQCVTFEELDALGVYHLKLWYVPTDQVFELTTGPSGQYFNEVDMVSPTSGRVAYTDDRWGQLDIFMTEFSLVWPDVAVSPSSVLFGDVETGRNTSTLVTVQNTGTADLNVSWALDPATAGVTIGTAQTSAVIAAGLSFDVPLTFAPTSVGAVSGALTLTTDVTGKESITVPISGNGVRTEQPAIEMAQELLAFYNDGLANQTLAGVGPGKSAPNRANALRNMIEAAGDLVASGRNAAAKSQLEDILKKCDGKGSPPDFIAGTARADMEARVRAIIATL